MDEEQSVVRDRDPVTEGCVQQLAQLMQAGQDSRLNTLLPCQQLKITDFSAALKLTIHTSTLIDSHRGKERDGASQ